MAISAVSPVADLADHDDVGVVAQERAQPGREGQLDLRVDRDLGDALQLVLDRILDGEDVEVGRVDLGQAGVERGGLARAGRPGDQHDAVRAVDELVHLAQVVVAEADVGQVEQHRLAIEQTDGDALARLTVGTVATRMSMSLPAILRRMRPSCGRRFSAMFRPAMIFTREMIEGMNCARRAGVTRTARRRCGSGPATSFSPGSMWISLARSLTALNSSELTQRMIGASSLTSRMSTSSSPRRLSSSSSPSRRARRPCPACGRRPR